MKVLHLFFFLAFCFCQGIGTAQESVQKKSKFRSRLQDGSDLLQEAKETVESDPAKSIELLQRALEYSIPVKSYEVEGESYFVLGEVNAALNQYDLAINYYEKGRTAYLKGNHTSKLYHLDKSFAHALKEVGNLPDALLKYDALLAQAVDNNNVDDQIFIHRARADIYKKQRLHTKALDELNLAESLVAKSKDKDGNTAAIKLERGGVYELQFNNTKAYQEYNASETIARSTNNTKAVLSSNAKQSSLLKREGKKRKAVEKQKEGLEYLINKDVNAEDAKKQTFFNNVNYESEILEQEEEEKVDILKEESKLSVEIGKNLLELDDNEEAIDYFKNAIEISSTSGEIQTEKDAYGLLSEAFSRAGKFTEALTTYKNYVNLVDSIYNLKESQILASLDLNEELSQRLQRISSLEKDRSLQEKTIALLESQRLAEEESNKRLRTLLYSLSIGLLLLLLLIYFMSRNSRQKKITNQLLALKNLRTQMNPHFIFNALNSVNNFISQSDERSANRYLSDFSRLMRLVLENSEHDFIPLAKELEILNLYIGLEHSRFSEKFDYALDVSPELNIEQFEIPPMIVQPYIENAVWHGLRYLKEKGHLQVSISGDSKKMKILVEDNGVGRTKSAELKTKNQKSSRSTAMKNIEERLKIINGLHKWKVTVELSDLNQDGSGTRVEIGIEEQ